MAAASLALFPPFQQVWSPTKGPTKAPSPFLAHITLGRTHDPFYINISNPIP